jgi:hypothetical protein
MMKSNQQDTEACLKDLDLQVIEARCLGIPYHSRYREEICDVSGRTVCESSIVPTVYIQDKIIQMRKASALSLVQRYDRLKKAGQIFAEATLAGLNPETYISLVSSVTGIQKSVIENSLTNIAYSLCHMAEILQAATPYGAVWDITDSAALQGCSLFSRRGDIISVVAAGNGPGVHALWPQAIAMGYRTLVKPSLREPFTAQRLVYAMELARLEGYVAFIPSDHKGAETMILESDLAIVYGGPDVAAKYANNPKVLVQGPGRSKIVVGRDVDYKEAVALTARSAMALGGAACVSASAVLVECAPEGFAKKLREEFTHHAIPQSHTLCSKQKSDLYKKMLKTDLDAPWSYKQTSQGCALPPHVTLVESVSDFKVQRELPFPCVTVAPFNSRDNSCYEALSNSLVVTVLSRQKKIISKVLTDSSISNVYIGNIPTTWMDFRVPHDGYLADFLMCNRGVRVETQWLTRLGKNK